jgi:hypothetical protein
VETGFPKRSWSNKKLEHDPEKHALGLDPMGGYRFSEKIMLKLNNPVRRAWAMKRPPAGKGGSQNSARRG